MPTFPFLKGARRLSEHHLIADELNGFVLHSYIEGADSGQPQTHYGVMKNFNADIVVVDIKNVIDRPSSMRYDSVADLDKGSDEKKWLIRRKPVKQNTSPTASRPFALPVPNSGMVRVKLDIRLEFAHFKPYSASKPLSW